MPVLYDPRVCPIHLIIMTPIKLAFLTTDNREQMGSYSMAEPFFGTAMTALLEGFALVPDEVDVHVISCSKIQMPAPPKLASNIWFHQPIVPKFGWGRSAFLGCGLAVRSLLKKIQPQIVHAQGTERDCAVSMMLAPTGPKLLTIHGHMARIAEITGAKFPSYYWLASRLESMAIRRADGVVSLTNYTQQRVEKGASRTWVIPNAVDSEFLNVQNIPQANLVLCVAGVHPWKRQVELMEALDLLEPAHRPQLVFIGNATASEYGDQFRTALSQRMEWCQHIDSLGREELRQWLAKAALLVLPSTEDNCPMVILEAMAAGIPVAASRIGGVPDLVDDGVTGRMFDPLIPQEIAAAVDSILSDTELAASMATNARQSANEKFHPLTIARQHLKLYHRLLDDCP
jgi:glycosyltransferase involved in cell wall biosynthesis